MRDPTLVTVRLPLRTDRLSIRAFALEDREAMSAIYADPEVMRFVDTRGEDPTTWVDGYAREQRERGWGVWAVVERATGELLGEAGLAPRDGRGPELELGYLLRRDAWGRGLATEAARACLAAAFDQLGAREVVAIVDEGNEASLAVLRKVGFRETGRRVRNGRRQHVLAARRALSA